MKRVLTIPPTTRFAAESNRLVEITPATLPEVREDLISVYRSAFSLPPHNESEREVVAFRGKLGDHAGREGFRLLVAKSDDAIVGFAYGFESEAGRLTQDVVRPLLTDEEFEFWFSDCFEFVELAVSTEGQGHGLGGRLHDDLLAGVPNRTAVLFVNTNARTALNLYQGRGWRILAGNIAPSDREVRLHLMGLRL